MAEEASLTVCHETTSKQAPRSHPKGRSAPPEPQALRILFHPTWQRAAFLLLWAVTAILLVSLMTFRNGRPMGPEELAVAVGFGALMPLTLLVGFRAKQAAQECRRNGPRQAAGGSAVVLSVFASAISCMCCLPLLPILLGAVLAGTALSGQAGAWSLTIAAWAPWLYAAAAGLLLWALHTNSRALVDAVDTQREA